MIPHFRQDNTDGYSDRDLEILNIRVAEILAEMGDIDEDDPNHQDNVKNACDRAQNEFNMPSMAFDKHPADGLGEVFTMDEFNQSLKQ